MRKFVAPVLCAVMMLGTAAVVEGCVVTTTEPARPPPPPPAPPPTAAPAPPPPATPAPALPTIENGHLKLPGPVVFETASDKLKPESDEVLMVVKNYLDAKPEITKIRIEGHTDNDGKKDGNQTLSEKRAMAVARWLIGKGIACKRLLPVGFGQMKPTAGTVDKQTADEKSQNRRTWFVNTELKGNAIGGLAQEGGGTVAGDPCK